MSRHVRWIVICEVQIALERFEFWQWKLKKDERFNYQLETTKLSTLLSINEINVTISVSTRKNSYFSWAGPRFGAQKAIRHQLVNGAQTFRFKIFPTVSRKLSVAQNGVVWIQRVIALSGLMFLPVFQLIYNTMLLLYLFLRLSSQFLLWLIKELQKVRHIRKLWV